MANNPFDENIQNYNILNNNIRDNNLIEIWLEQFGRKKNTYIAGWSLSDNELKEHIKIFKKSYGCNGTLKNNNDNIKVIMFQGDQINNILNYLKKQDIDISNINIKGS